MSRLKFFTALILAITFYSLPCYNNNLVVQDTPFTINATTNTKLPCLMLACSEDETLVKLAKDLVYDLEFTDQLAIDLKKTPTKPSDAVLKKLFSQGTSLTVFLEPTRMATPKKRGSVKITVTDTHSGKNVLNETFSYGQKTAYFDSHEIAGKVLPALTREQSPFSGTLAYCKQYSSVHKVVCMSDVAGRHEQVVVPNHTLSVAPRWHPEAPVLLFSQFTKSNTNLMSVNVHSCKQRTICSYDGLNMQPSFSGDGKEVALCMSGKSGNTEIYIYDHTTSKKKKHRVFRQVTHNHGNNTYPTLLADGNVLFCSDFQTGSPQIYLLDRKKHVTRRLSNGQGYCAAPSFNPETRTIVYTRLIAGNFQLFSMNMDDPAHKEKQLTFGFGDKIDPAWSPCGRFVAFTLDAQDETTKKRIPQIGILNCASRAIRIATHGNQPKSYPTWINKPYYAT